MKQKQKHIVDSDLENVEKTNRKGLCCARFFKYHQQFIDSSVSKPEKLKDIEVGRFYRCHKKKFNEIAIVCSKLHIDFSDYMRYLAQDRKLIGSHIESKLLSSFFLREYIASLQIKAQKRKIFRYFMKSANNIADDCARLGYVTTLDYLRYLIRERKLAAYYLTGVISKYYLAAIPKFPELVSKLDQLSKDEFQLLCGKYEKYNIDIKEAMLQEKKQILSVMNYTDDLILSRRSSAAV